jgi:hypothetical protein
MAAGDSIVSICNAALIALGEMPITALTDPNKRAGLCSARYDSVRRDVLRGHPWNCAMTMVALAASTTAPVTKYAYAYPLPADCLRLIDVPDMADQDSYDVMSGSVLCDSDPALNIIYVRDLTDPTQFDPSLAKVLGLALAVDICMSLTQSGAIKQAVQADLNALMSEARLVGSQENSPPELDVDVLLRSRS